MNDRKPFILNLLYFAVGVVPIIVIAYISQLDLEKYPRNLLWFGVFGSSIMVAILVQRKLRKKGVLDLKEADTYIALLIVAAIGFVLLREIV